jgi:RimJ/RimL family protein N-acetyltransferase
LVPGDKVEIGYWSGAEFHGAGYGFEAANEMLFENHKSFHLLKNLGFKETGIDGARL